MKIKTDAKSLSGLKKKNRERRRTRVKGSEEEVQNLLEMQREAVQQKMGESGGGLISQGIGGLKGLQEAYNIQEEYKVAKSGVQSRYGKFAKAFGLADERQAAMIDKLFGKKVPEEELKKMREKYKIKDEKEEEEKKPKAEKAVKKEQSERSKLRDEQITKIKDLAEKINSVVEGIKSSVDGIANKLRASPAKAAPKSKKEMRKLEKQAGLKYSKEASRYRDAKTGKFVSSETARQRMNISPTASASKVEAKTAAPVAGAAGAAMAPATPEAAGTSSPTATKEVDTDLKSQTLEGAPAEQKDPTDDKLNKLAKDVKKVDEGVQEILDIFSLKSFYKLIGGAMGLAFPVLKNAIEFIWDIGSKGVAWVTDLATSIWNKVRDFLTGIKLDIPEIMGPFTVDLPGLDPFTIGPIGGFTFEPFKFLKKPIEAPDAVTPPAPAAQAAAAPKPAAAAPSAAPAPSAPSAAPAPSAPSAPATIPAAPPAAAPAAGAASTTTGPASRQGGNMPGAAAPPPKEKKSDAGGAKQAAMDAAQKYGITGEHLAQFMAQIDHESGHFKRLEENLNYSAKRLMEIFPKYYKDPALAEAEQRNPQLIANRVYGGRMGNGPPESGEGYRYRGRGLIQLTGKNNYERFGKIVGMDLVSNPDSAAELSTAASLAAAYYKKTVLDAGIEAQDTKRVTKAINGGSIGLSDRANLFALYQKQTPSAAPGGMGGAAPAGGPVYAAAGGVASGPITGYPATLHGTEAIVPLDGQSHQSKQAVAAVSKAVSGEQLGQQSAENLMASTGPSVVPVPVPTGGGGQKATQPPTPNNSGVVKAEPRFADDTFNRAISRDFAHPTAFTSVGLA